MSIFLSLSGHFSYVHMIHRYRVNILCRVMSYIKLWHLQCFAFFTKIYRARGSDYIKLAYKSTVSNVRKKLHFVVLFATALIARKVDASGTSRPVAAGALNLKFWFLLLPIQLAKRE